MADRIITVSKSGSPSADYSSIQAAVNAVSVPRSGDSGDTIIRILDGDWYNEQVMLQADTNTGGNRLIIERDFTSNKYPVWGYNANGQPILSCSGNVNDVTMRGFTQNFNAGGHVRIKGTGWIFEKNYLMHSSTNQPFVLAQGAADGADEFIFRNNMFQKYACNTGAIRVYGCDDVKIYHNAFHNDNSNSSVAIKVENSSSNVKIKNNTFTGHSLSNGYFGVYVASNSQVGFECDYNVYQQPYEDPWGTPVLQPFGFDGSARATFALWQAQGWDTNSHYGNANLMEFGFVAKSFMGGVTGADVSADCADDFNGDTRVSFFPGPIEYMGADTSVYPAANKVVSDAGNYGPTGSEYTPNFADVVEGDVEAGVEWGGTDIKKTGTFTVPSEADVNDGTGYGAGGTEFEGTLVIPDTSQYGMIAAELTSKSFEVILTG